MATHQYRRPALAYVLTTLLIVAFFAAVGWFLGSDVFRAREAKSFVYGLHIAGGIVVLAVAPIQFVTPIRNRFRTYHRWAGYAFTGGSAAAIIGFFLILPVQLDIFLVSQLMAIMLWAASIAAALVAIRRRHVLTHQHNMARAFVLAAYFVVVRIVDQHLMWLLEPISKVEAARYAHSDWLSWVIPVIAVEIWFGRKWDQTLNRRRSEALPRSDLAE